MKPEHTSIHKAVVNSPYGIFLVAVKTTPHDARSDVFGCFTATFPCHYGLLRVGEVTKSNRRILADMEPMKKCISPEQWGWCKRIG